MKIFLDANILVSVMNKEYPLFSWSARILSLAGKPGYELYTTGLCLAIASYFAEKKNRRTAMAKTRLLASHLKIAPIDDRIVQKTIADKRIHDFEDGLEYNAAVQSGCTCLITEDQRDFFFSEMEVVDAEGFCEKYL